MKNIYAGINQAYYSLFRQVLEYGVREGSRNGPVLTMVDPVMTVIARATDRVLWDGERDANPFLNLFDGLSIFCARSRVYPLAHFTKQLLEYTEDGQHISAAYGNRLRRHFGADQITFAVEELKRNRETRRVALTLWNPAVDVQRAQAGWKDVPCNGYITARTNDNVLSLMVANRSNDLLWGLFGANVPQFSFLNEYIALASGLKPGPVTYVTSNLHVYTEFGPMAKMMRQRDTMQELARDLYRAGASFTPPDNVARAVPLLHPHEKAPDFLVGVDMLFEACEPGDLLEPEFISHLHRCSSFLADVAVPMWQAHVMHKRGRTGDAERLLRDSTPPGQVLPDWHAAGLLWLNRRTVQAANGGEG